MTKIHKVKYFLRCFRLVFRQHRRFRLGPGVEWILLVSMFRNLLLFCIVLSVSVFTSCSSSKKEPSKDVISSGLLLSQHVYLFEKKNGVYPDSLELLFKEPENQLNEMINNQVAEGLWEYQKGKSDDGKTYYFIFYKKVIDSEVYVFMPSLEYRKIKVAR
jgi:hypothetical protein